MCSAAFIEKIRMPRSKMMWILIKCFNKNGQLQNISNL